MWLFQYNSTKVLKDGKSWLINFPLHSPSQPPEHLYPMDYPNETVANFNRFLQQHHRSYLNKFIRFYVWPLVNSFVIPTDYALLWNNFLTTSLPVFTVNLRSIHNSPLWAIFIHLNTTVFEALYLCRSVHHPLTNHIALYQLYILRAVGLLNSNTSAFLCSTHKDLLRMRVYC